MRVVFFIGSVGIILSLISYIYYRQNFAFARTLPFALIYLLLAANTAISRLLGENTPALILKLSSWFAGLWIAFIYYSTLLAIIHLLLWLSSKFTSLHLPSAKLAAVGTVFILTFISWGAYRAFHPVVRTEQITTNKLPAGQQTKIVLLSDIHLGRVLGRDYAEQLAEKINEQKPDFVLIAGDILDERIAYVTQEDSLTPLKKISAPLGIWAAYGNHDYLDRPAVWRQMLNDNNINVLQDESHYIGNIKLTGLNDYSRRRDDKMLMQLSSDNANYYSILLDHQPRRIQPASEAGYDLYLAGHTHTGQLFPNRLVTQNMYPLDYGRKEFGSLTAITSNGYGFWGPPVRTELAPEIIVINLQSNQ